MPFLRDALIVATSVCVRVYVLKPLLGVEEGEDVLAGHETLFHVTQLQVVHLQHVLLLLLLQGETKKHISLAGGKKKRLTLLKVGFILYKRHN